MIRAILWWAGCGLALSALTRHADLVLAVVVVAAVGIAWLLVARRRTPISWLFGLALGLSLVWLAAGVIFADSFSSGQVVWVLPEHSFESGVVLGGAVTTGALEYASRAAVDAIAVGAVLLAAWVLPAPRELARLCEVLAGRAAPALLPLAFVTSSRSWREASARADAWWATSPARSAPAWHAPVRLAAFILASAASLVVAVGGLDVAGVDLLGGVLIWQLVVGAALEVRRAAPRAGAMTRQARIGDEVVAELTDFSLWLPGRGLLLDQITFTPVGLTVVVGRNGAGTSTLLRATAGKVPHDARVRGGHPRPADTLISLVETSDHLLDRTVAELAEGVDRELLAALGVLARSGQATSELDASTRHALCIGHALALPGTRLLLLDQPMTRLSPEHRGPLAEAVHRAVRAGVVVVWAEHVLEDVLDHADFVAELHEGRLHMQPAGQWTSRHLPAPPHHAAARLLGHDPRTWGDLERLGADERVRDALPRGGSNGPDRGTRVTADGSVSRLGVDLDLHRGETVGVLAPLGRDDEAVRQAQRLVAIWRGQRRLPGAVELPPRTRLDSYLRRVAGGDDEQAAVLLEHCRELAPVHPRRRLGELSDGEQAVVRWVVAATSDRPALLVHPEASLDPANRRRVARALREGKGPGAVAVISDPEFAARACHRLVLLTPDGPVHGTPTVVADRMPVPPVLRRAGARILRVEELA